MNYGHDQTTREHQKDRPPGYAQLIGIDLHREFTSHWKLLAGSSSSQNTVTSLTQWWAVAYSDWELHAELIRLLEKQIELMELATCVRLMDAELSEYETRQKRISEVLEQLSS